MSVIHTYSEIIFEISENPDEAQTQIEKVSKIFGHKAAPDIVTPERAGLMGQGWHNMALDIENNIIPELEEAKKPGGNKPTFS